MTTTTPTVTRNLDLDLLARQIDRDGVRAHQPEVLHLALQARTAGIARVATSVLVDPAEPEPVRERAFAHVAIALHRERARHLVAA